MRSCCGESLSMGSVAERDRAEYRGQEIFVFADIASRKELVAFQARQDLLAATWRSHPRQKLARNGECKERVFPGSERRRSLPLHQYEFRLPARLRPAKLRRLRHDARPLNVVRLAMSNGKINVFRFRYRWLFYREAISSRLH